MAGRQRLRKSDHFVGQHPAFGHLPRRREHGHRRADPGAPPRSAARRAHAARVRTPLRLDARARGTRRGPHGSQLARHLRLPAAVRGQQRGRDHERGPGRPLPAGPGWLVEPREPHGSCLRAGSVGTGFQFTDPVARRSYLFDAATGRLMQILDEHGNALTLSYVGGQLSQVSDGLGRALAFGYDPLGFLSSVSDGTRSVSFAYAGGVLTGATDAAGHPWSYAYDAAAGFPGLLTAVTEPLGNAPVLQGYDALGRVATQTDAANGAAAYAFDTPLGNTFTDPLGNTWKYLHDTQNRLVTLLDPGSLPWSFAYDALGRLSSVTRPLSDATTFDYDPASGYPSAVGFADGTSIHWSYSPHAAGGATFFDLAGTLYPDLSSSSC